MSNNYLPTSYQEFIHLSRYSRWLPEEKRRETWNETIERYFSFFDEHLNDMHNYKLPNSVRDKLENGVLGLDVMPSMRCLMTAGEALKRENIAGYNCSYVAVNRVQAFDEILYVLMNGTGVGFSVERQEVSKLPRVSEEFYESDTVISVADSKLGWAKAFKELVGLLYIGQIPRWDLTKVRPAGAPLKTFGGRASGPEPLENLFNFTVNTFKNAHGRQLSSLECHDIVCKIAEIVKQIRKYVEEDYSVVLWPHNIKEKDINEMIMSGKTRRQIKTIIEENTYSGIRARGEFAKWSKTNV